MSDHNQEQPRVCDYEGSTYRTDFWEGQGRQYEDLVERDVLQRLLPKTGKRLLEIGAGFGRLSQEYHMYENVVLMDYSFSQLQYARERLGDERFTYVAANIYALPFQSGVFDGATMIRVIHHLEDAPAALQQIRHVLVPDSVFILEFANKRNLKALIRHGLRRQNWNPNDREPVEFVELNFNFHPQYIREQLATHHFELNQEIPVSFLRLGILKRLVPDGFLARTDRVLQTTKAGITPSVFTKNLAVSTTPSNLDLSPPEMFVCPQTRQPLTRQGDVLLTQDGIAWQIRDGIYDFKTPAASP